MQPDVTSRKTWKAWKRREVVTVFLALGWGSGAVACNQPQAGETGAVAPAAPGSGGPVGAGTQLPAAPQAAQEIAIQIVGGRFPAIRFNVQPGQVRLNVNARGGPYTLRIDPLVPPQRLAPDSTTLVGFTVTAPGEYVMELMGGAATETAILDVRPAAGR